MLPLKMTTCFRDIGLFYVTILFRAVAGGKVNGAITRTAAGLVKAQSSH